MGTGFISKNTRRSWILILTIVLNSLDGLFTLYEIKHGLATEFNPLMAWLLHLNLFIQFKFLVNIFIVFLYTQKQKMAQYGLNICFYVYFFICMYHISRLFVL